MRLHDSPALEAARAGAACLLPVLAIDPAPFRATGTTLARSGPYRARFLLAAAAELRAALRARRSELVVRVGAPSDVIPALAASIGATRVVVTEGVSYADRAADAAVETALAALDRGPPLARVWAGTLTDVEVLGGSPDGVPATFSEFRALADAAPARSPLPAPATLPRTPPRCPPAGELPTEEALVGDAAAVAAAAGDGAAVGAGLAGGERAALDALRAASSSSPPSSLSLVSQLAPWLAGGCLSPRRALAGAGAARAAVAAELAWRDFFRFTTAKLAAVTAGEKRRVGGLAAA